VDGDLVTPVWILGVLAALMLAVAAVSAARVAAVCAVRGWRHGAVIADTDVAHLLMAVAMAGMLAPGLGILPSAGWETVFALLAVWFAIRVLADAGRNGIRALAGGHCAPHLVHSGSMLYMFLAASLPAARASGTGGMPGGPGRGTMALSHPTLAYAFALVLVGYAIWDLDRLSGRRHAIGTRVSLAGAGGIGAAGMSVLAGGGFLRSPAVTVGCRITMGITMAFMLLIAR